MSQVSVKMAISVMFSSNIASTASAFGKWLRILVSKTDTDLSLETGVERLGVSKGRCSRHMGSCNERYELSSTVESVPAS